MAGGLSKGEPLLYSLGKESTHQSKEKGHKNVNGGKVERGESSQQQLRREESIFSMSEGDKCNQRRGGAVGLR